MWFIDILQKVPNVIWGTIIGSAITLFGTWLQGRNNLKMLLHKEDTDRKNAKEQRNFDIRKDEYLKALSAMTDLNSLIANFTNPGFKYDEFSKKMQSIFKELLSLEIVADEKTLEPIHKFQQNYFHCAVELMNLKIPLEMLVDDESRAQNGYKIYNNKINENIEQLKQNPYKDPEEIQKFVEMMGSRYNEYCEERDKYSLEMDKLQKQIFDLNIDLKRIIVDQLMSVQKYIDEFVQFARKDLDLPAIALNESSIQKFFKSVHDSLEMTINNAKKIMQEEEEVGYASKN